MPCILRTFPSFRFELRAGLRILFAFSLEFFLISATASAQDTTYEYTELGVSNSGGVSINESGDGVFDTYRFSPLLGIQPIVVPGAGPLSSDVFVRSNDFGTAVGTRIRIVQGPGGILCSTSSFGLLDAPSSFFTSATALFDINNAGNLVGRCGGECLDPYVGRRNAACGFINTVKEEFLFDVADPTSDRALDINISNWIVGTASKMVGGVPHRKAFLKIPGSALRDLGTLGGKLSVAIKLNDAGAIVGEADLTDSISHAFLFDTLGDEIMIDLGTLGGPRSLAYGINSSNLIVGTSTLSDGSIYNAFISHSGNQMVNLNNLVTNLPTGTVLEQAFAINNRGEITGIARISDTDRRAFLLRPKISLGNARSDFSGDGNGDFVVWRPTSGTWFIRPSSDDLNILPPNFVTRQWGLPGDIPLSGDYDGDGRIDLTVWRPQSGVWYTCSSSEQYNCSLGSAVQFGLPGDYPVVGDFDGDGKDDQAVWRPLLILPGVTIIGQWYIRQSSNSAVLTRQFGLPYDLPVQGDYNGDGRTDFAVYRPSTGVWYVRYSSRPEQEPEPTFERQWGLPGDLPMPGDFDGDGKTDLAVWRPTDGSWYVCSSRSSFDCTRGVGVQFGLPGDVPIAASFDGNSVTNYAVWRSSSRTNSGDWFFRNALNGQVKQTFWGLPGDIPLGRGIVHIIGGQ